MAYKNKLTIEKQKLVEDIKELYIIMDINQKAKCFGTTLGIIALIGVEDATMLKILKNQVNKIYSGDI